MCLSPPLSAPVTPSVTSAAQYFVCFCLWVSSCLRGKTGRGSEALPCGACVLPKATEQGGRSSWLGGDSRAESLVLVKRQPREVWGRTRPAGRAAFTIQRPEAGMSLAYICKVMWLEPSKDRGQRTQVRTEARRGQGGRTVRFSQVLGVTLY